MGGNTLKELLNPYREKTRIHQVMDSKGKMQTHPKTVAKAFANFYGDLYNSEHPDRKPAPTLPRGPRPPAITAQELQDTLHSFADGKTQDEIGLVIEMVKRASWRTKIELAVQYTKLLWEGEGRPMDWDDNPLTLIFKKGAAQDMGNYRPITLLPTLYKLFSKILFLRIRAGLEGHLTKDSAGFRKGFNTEDHILAITLMVQYAQEWKIELWIGKLDVTKAFDTLGWDAIQNMLKAFGLDDYYIRAVMQSYQCSRGRVRIPGARSGPFPKTRGTRQGDPLSALLFACTLEHLLRPLTDKWKREGKGFPVNVHDALDFLNNLRYADDMVLVARSAAELQEMFKEVQEALATAQLHIHPEKTQIITNCTTQRPESLTILGQEITIPPMDASLEYLGTLLSFQDTTRIQVEHRIKAGWAKFHQTKAATTFKYASLHARLRLFDQSVTATVTHGACAWTWSQETETSLIKAQCQMLRKIIHTPRPGGMGAGEWLRVHNERVKRTIHKTGGKFFEEEALRRIWRMAGHIARRTPDSNWSRPLLDTAPMPHTKSPRNAFGRNYST